LKQHNVVMETMSIRFEEVKDALFGGIDQMRRTVKELWKASEDLLHDVCVTMQNMASSLEKTLAHCMKSTQGNRRLLRTIQIIP
jgi:hypothetical protein